MTQPTSPAYKAAQEGCAYYPIPDAGILMIAGEDRLDFLQRQTTNDLSGLSSQRSVVTVLSSPTARILDVLRVIQVPDALRVVTLPGFHTNTLNYLKKRIFFMDQVEIEDASQQFRQYELLGPQSTDVLRRMGFETIPSPDEVGVSEDPQLNLTMIRQPRYIGAGFRLITPRNAEDEFSSLLNTLGAEQLEAEFYAILRVEAGIPGAGAELSDQYNPLEVGLDRTVSDSKGCYTGQEVLARQITYDKVAQIMVGLKLGSPAEPGSRLAVDDRTVGAITSCVISPRFGPIALGIVRRAHSQVGTKLAVNGPDNKTSATVTELPFKA